MNIRDIPVHALAEKGEDVTAAMKDLSGRPLS